jgi:hypothetical protein
MEAIWSALHPISASRRAVALRKPCRRYAVASGGVAQFPKPIAKAGRGVGLAEVRDQERLDAHGRRRVDDGAQLGMQRDFEVRPLKHHAHCVKEVALRERRGGLAIDESLHVLWREQHDAAPAVVGA